MPNHLTAKQTFERRRRFREKALAKGNLRLQAINNNLTQIAALLEEARLNFQDAERNDLHLEELQAALALIQEGLADRLSKLPKPYKR